MIQKRILFSILMITGSTLLVGCGEKNKSSDAVVMSRSDNESPTSYRKHQPAINDMQVVRKVVCLYDNSPFFSADAYGDRDPEGVVFKVFLKKSDKKSVIEEGTFHVYIYKIIPNVDEKKRRELIGDYHYSSAEINKIKKPGLMGPGYVMQLVWGVNDINAKEIEVICEFEDVHGNIARAQTKRLRVPKFST